MPFDSDSRKEIRKRAGYYCQICGTWRQPHRDDLGSTLEAHSSDKSHEGVNGAALCSHELENCHQRIHDITDDPKQLNNITITAVNLNNLSMAFELERRGLPERRIQRILKRMGTI